MCAPGMFRSPTSGRSFDIFNPAPSLAKAAKPVLGERLSRTLFDPDPYNLHQPVQPITILPSGVGFRSVSPEQWQQLSDVASSAQSTSTQNRII